MDIELLTVDQVARACQVSSRTVMRAIEAGDLRASQLATRGVWRVREEDVEAWLDLRANRRREPAPGSSDSPTVTSTVRSGSSGHRGRISDLVTPDMGRDRRR